MSEENNHSQNNNNSYSEPPPFCPEQRSTLGAIVTGFLTGVAATLTAIHLINKD